MPRPSAVSATTVQRRPLPIATPRLRGRSRDQQWLSLRATSERLPSDAPDASLGRAASVRRRAIGARPAPASVTRQWRHADCPYRCTRSADGRLTPGTARCSPSRNQQRRSRYRSPARRAGAILRPTRTRPLPHHRRRSGRSRRRRAQRPPTAGHDVLGLDIGAGRSGSSPTSTIVLSQRAARRRQRDDPIALPSTWVVAHIAGRSG